MVKFDEDLDDNEDVKAARRRAEEGDVVEMIGLAVWYARTTRLGESEVWARRAAETDRPEGMAALGAVLIERGAFAEAEDWLRKALDRGHTEAAGNLGMVMVIRGGNLYEAGRLCQRGAAAGSAAGMVGLGLLAKLLESDDADAWLRRAAEAGDARGMFVLGTNLADAGQIDQAMTWLGKAANNGHPLAWESLAALAEEHLTLDEVEPEYRDRVKSRDVAAMMALAAVHARSGDRDEAEDLYEDLARLMGNDAAMVRLGLLCEADRPAEAEAWLRRAAEGGSLEIGRRAARHLGELLERNGDVTGARAWYRRAAEAGNMEAALPLARLLEQQGDPAQAKLWRDRAAAARRSQRPHGLRRLLRPLAMSLVRRSLSASPEAKDARAQLSPEHAGEGAAHDG